MTAFVPAITAAFLTITGPAAPCLLPVLAGLARHVLSTGAPARVSVLAGWALLGWAAALTMAPCPARRAAPRSARHASSRGGLLAPRPGAPPPLHLRPRAAATRPDCGPAGLRP